MSIKNFFKGIFTGASTPQFNVTIYLKSGQKIKLRCIDFSAERNNDNELTSVSWQLSNGNTKILYLRCNDVSFIHSEKA